MFSISKKIRFIFIRVASFIRAEFGKFVWAICLLICTCSCFYFLTKCMLDFLSNEVKTNIEVIKEKSLEFPAITICNLNPFNTNNPEINRELHQVLKDNYDYENVKKGNEPNNFMSIASRNLKNWITIQNDEVKKNYGIRLEEMLINCIYNTESCSNQNLSNFKWSYRY
jgi:hypothetical protein